MGLDGGGVMTLVMQVFIGTSALGLLVAVVRGWGHGGVR